jgi:hypothetical protein
MGYGGYGGPMAGFFGGFGILFVVLYAAVVIYALLQLTKIARSLQLIAASLERMGKITAPKNPNDV